MSAKDKSGLGYGTQIHKGVLSYENQVLESVFESRPSDIKDSHVNDRFAKVEGMHAVPPQMTWIYMPPKYNFGIDESKFTYGLKQSKNGESDAKTSNLASCDSNSSVETLESVPKPVESKLKAVNEPKVWSDALIIEEYKFSVNSARQNFFSQAVSTSTVRKVNTARQMDNPHQTLKGKDIVDCGCLRRMARNKAYLVEYQDFNGGPVAFGGSKGQITGIKREYSNARTPQQNGVAERKNKTLIKAARTMLADSFLPNTFWDEAVSTACYVLNRPVTLENKANKTAGLKEANNSTGTQDNLDVGNSQMKAEHLNENIGSKKNKEPVDQEDQAFLEELEKLRRQEKEANNAAETLRKTFTQNTTDLLLQAGAARASSTNYVNIVSTPVNIVSTPVNTASIPVKTASLLRNVNAASLSSPDLLTYANQDDSHIPSLEDIYAIPNDGIFTSVSYDAEGAVADFTNLQSSMNVIGKKSIYKNKKDETGVVVRNKARLVAQGHIQEEGIDYDEVFAHVARLEAIEIFLAFASYMRLIVYQMDVKSASYMAKLMMRGIIDKTLFIKKDQKDIMLMSSMGKLTFFLGLQVKQKEDGTFISQDKYVAEIVKKFNFMTVKTASTPIKTKKHLVKDVEAADVAVHLYKYMIGSLMYLITSRPDIMRLITWQCKKQTIVATSTIEAEYVTAVNCCRQVLWIQNQMFQMRSMGEPTFFLGLQVNQREDGIFISQDKYVAEILKKFDFISVKTTSTPIETKKPLVKDTKAADVDVHLYRSMIGSLMYLTTSRPDIMYAVCACSRFQVTPKTSHLQAVKRIFRHHFIKVAYEKKLIHVLKIHTDDNGADLLTKAFDASRFNFLIVNIGMLNL
nr:hypothetical protein [Tanacetum cinerariifolium]